MFKQITILCLVVLAGSVVFCRKEAAPQPEPRTLRIYCDGVLKREIDITDWEVNEDVVVLGYFYYPWQGEDSINYDCYDPWEGQRWLPAMFLHVNGKLVGVSTDIMAPEDIPDPERIVTVMYYYYEKGYVEDLQLFPNLIGALVTIDSSQGLKKLDSISSNLRLYLDCYRITNSDLRKLAQFQNIRILALDNCNGVTNCGFRHLRKFKELRRLRVLYMPHITQRGLRHLKYLPKLRYVDVNEGWI